MSPLPLCADSQIVVQNNNSHGYHTWFEYDSLTVRFNTTLQMSGTTATLIFREAAGDIPTHMTLDTASESIATFDPLGTPGVVRVVAMQKPGCTDDCISLTFRDVRPGNTLIMVSDMLPGAVSNDVRALLTWADLQPSDELALFYKSLFAV